MAVRVKTSKPLEIFNKSFMTYFDVGFDIDRDGVGR